MSSISSQFFPTTSGTLKFQEFSSSGTFTPSASLLAKGGNVLVQALGGGSSGVAVKSQNTNQPCGHAGRYVEAVVNVTGPVTVTIGAGGTAVTATSGALPGNAGGDTTFGSLVTAKGAVAPVVGSNQAICGDGSSTPATISYDGTSMVSKPGYGVNGRGGGGSANATYPAVDGGGNAVAATGSSSPVTGGSAAANSGGGGGSAANTGTGNAISGAGGSGWVRVTWVE